MLQIWDRTTMAIKFFFVCVICSLHLSLWPAAWVTSNEDELQQPLFLAATRVSWMLNILHVLPRRLSCCSLLTPHPSNQVSCSVHALRAWDRVLFSSALARLWSFTGAPVFPFLIRFSINCSSWRQDSISRPSERMSTILPQDHGVLAWLLSCNVSSLP